MAFSHPCFSSHHFAVFQQQLLMHLVLPLQRKLDDFQWQILCTVDGWFQVQRKKLGGQVFKDLLSLYCNLPHKTEILQKICLFSVFLKTSWPYEPFYVMKIALLCLLCLCHEWPYEPFYVMIKLLCCLVMRWMIITSHKETFHFGGILIIFFCSKACLDL